ncbi:MAG: ABC transporter ATP-binding protein [Ignisphaera sp.]
MKIVVEDVEVWYNSAKALDRVTLSISSGELAFVIGPNGAGKTTLLKTIASIVKPKKGVVYIDGKAVSSLSPKDISRILSYVDPHISRSIPSTVLEFLLTARYPHQNMLSFSISAKDLEMVEKISEQLNIKQFLDRRLDQLSSGELQRILIARALVQEPKVLLLDEPSAFLDLRYRLEVLDYVKSVVKRSSIVAIVAIHDIYLASLYADKIIVMNGGSVVVCGTPEEVLKKDVLEKVYGVRIAIVNVDGRKIVVPLEPLEKEFRYEVKGDN